MNYKIREITPTEYEILNDFLYEAIFIPEGVEPPPKSIIEKNELQVYVKDFGKYPDDILNAVANRAKYANRYVRFATAFSINAL